MTAQRSQASFTRGRVTQKLALAAVGRCSPAGASSSGSTSTSSSTLVPRVESLGIPEVDGPDDRECPDLSAITHAPVGQCSLVEELLNEVGP